MVNTTEFVYPTKPSIKSWSSPPSPRTPRGAQIPAVEPDGAPSVPCYPDDKELTTLVHANIDVFDQLIERYRCMCMRRAFVTMHSLSDAEDAVQNALRKAFQHLEQFQGSGMFAGWLGRIVENECLMRIRKERNAHFVYLDNTIGSKVRLELVAPIMNPEDELGREEVIKVLQNEMAHMPPLFRNVMLLHDIELLPIPDVAERLGISIPAAKSRLSRARSELRIRIGKHCGRKGPGTLLEKALYSSTAYARAS